MAEIGGICCGGIFILSGIGFIFDAGRKYLLAQSIRNTPTSKVRSAAVGLVELSGRVSLIGDLVSPVSKAKCSYYSVKCEYFRPSKRRSDWVTVFNRAISGSFHLEDETGKMLVDPFDAEISVPADFQWEGHLTDKGFFGLIPQKQIDAKVLAFLDENPEAKESFMRHKGRKFRVTETFLAGGDPVFVLGSAAPVERGSALAHENLVVRKDPSVNILFISDSGEKKALERTEYEMLWEAALGFILVAVVSLLLLFGE